MAKKLSIFAIFLLLFSFILPFFPSSKAESASVDSMLSLGENVTGWTIDPTNKMIYTVTSAGNLDFISYGSSLKVTKQIALPGSASDIKQVGNTLYIAISSVQKIVEVDLTSKTVSKTISTGHSPSRIAVGTNKIYYVTNTDSSLYQYDTTTSTESTLSIPNVISFYQAALAINRSTQTLYVGESGLSGCRIMSISTADGSVKSKSTYDDSYGFPNPQRHLLLNGNSVYYAGRELNASNLADINGTYIKDMSGYTAADIIGVSPNYVFTENGVYNRQTYLKVGDTPSTLQYELNDGNEMFYVGADGQTIYSKTYQAPSDTYTQPATINHKLTMEYNLSDWVLDEANHSIYAVSKEGNKLYKINTQTMTINNQVTIGSMPTDIKLVNGKLYIALFGSTKVAIVDPSTLNTLSLKTTLQNPYKIATNGTDLYYVTEDQWSYVYDLNLSSGAEQKLTSNTYYEPDIALDSTTNQLYVGESANSGSNLYVLDATNGSVLQQSDFNSGYGFSYPKRKVILNGDSVYFAGYRLSKSDVTNEMTKYFDPSSDKILSVNGTDVFAGNNIYDKSTFSTKYNFQKHPESLAAENSQGQIFTYVPAMGAVYRFDSMDKLVNQKVDNLAGSFNTAGNYSLNWNEGTGDFYSVEVDQNNVASPKQHSFIFSDSQLKSFYGFTKTFGVKNNFADVQSAASTFQHYFTIPVPTGLAAKKSNNSDDVTLSWNPVRLMDGYNVYAYTNDPTAKTLVNLSPVTGNTFTIPQDKRLEWAGQTVHFIVKSFVNNKESKASTPVDYTFPVPVPTDLTAKKADGSNDVVIGWKAINHMDGYTVSAYTNDPTVKTILNAQPVTDNHFTIPVDMQKQWIGKTIHFVVSSWANGKESTDSSPVDYTFTMPVPTQLKATKSDGSDDLVLDWKGISYMDGYNVYMYTDDPSKKTLLNQKPVTDNTYTIGFATQEKWSGKTVHLEVTALKNGKESAASNSVDFTFKYPVPSNYHISIEKNYDTVLNWNAIKDADGYNVYYYTAANPSKKILINAKPITKNTYTIPEPAWPKWKKKFYFYVAVKALYGNRESPLSQPIKLIWIPDSTSTDNNQPATNNNGSSGDQTSSGTTSNTGTTSNNGSSAQSGTSGQTTSGTTTNQSTTTSGSNNTNQTTTSTNTNQNSTSSSTSSGTNSTGTFDSGLQVQTTITNTTITIPSGSLQNLKSGSLVNVNLSSEQKDLTNVVFQPDQMDKLISEKSSISIERSTSTVTLPTSIFKDGSVKTTVSVAKLDPVDGSVGDVYDFKIHQGSDVISHFDQPVTLSFKVDPSKVTDPQSLKVYYWNTDTKQWQLIGGTYKDGVVTAQTIHFSTYGVFEKQTVKKAAAPNLKKITSESAANPLQKSKSKKNEGASGIWIALITLLVIACGFSAFILARRKKA